MDYLDKLEKRISHISILDIISSKIRKHPSSINEYSAEWDRNLSDFLDTNPEVVNNEFGCFDDGKWYVDVGIDDKYGFDPHNDWYNIMKFFEFKHKWSD